MLDSLKADLETTYLHKLGLPTQTLCCLKLNNWMLETRESFHYQWLEFPVHPTVLFELIEIDSFFHSFTLVYLAKVIIRIVYLLFTSNATGQ